MDSAPEMEPYAQGIKAGWDYFQTNRVSKNPFPAGTPEFRQWDEGYWYGWRDADAIDSAEL